MSHEYSCLNILLSIVVEFAKEGRTRREPFEERSFARRMRPAGFRITVDNISRDTSWQVRLRLYNYLFSLLTNNFRH